MRKKNFTSPAGVLGRVAFVVPCAGVLFGMGVLGAGAAQALDWDLRLAASSEWSDNADRSATNEQIDWRHTPSAAGTLKHEGKRVTADASYRVEYADSRNDVQEDRDSTTGRANIVAVLVPDRLSWSLSNVRTETTRNAATLDIADNRQITNVIQTGPSLTLPLSGRDSLNLSANASRVAVEDTANDSVRGSANATWRHQFSRRLTSGLFASYNHTEYDQDGLSDVKRTNAGLDTSIDWARTVIAGTLGWNEVRRRGQKTVSGFSADLTGSYQLSRQLTVTAGASRQLTDQSSQFNSLQAVPDGGQFQDSDQSDVFLAESVDVSVAWQGSAWRVTGRGAFQSQDYEVVDRDRITRTWSLDLTRSFGKRLRGFVRGRYQDFDFRGVDRDDEEIDASVGVTWTPIRRTDLSLQVRRRERDSTDPTFEYEENLVLVSLGYQLSSSR